MEELKKIAKHIEKLEIQGATNVAIEGVKAFGKYIATLKETNLDDFFKKVTKAQNILETARATEPCLRNGLKFTIDKAKNTISNLDNIDMLKKRMNECSEEFLGLL